GGSAPLHGAALVVDDHARVAGDAIDAIGARPELQASQAHELLRLERVDLERRTLALEREPVTQRADEACDLDRAPTPLRCAELLRLEGRERVLGGTRERPLERGVIEIVQRARRTQITPQTLEHRVQQRAAHARIESRRDRRERARMQAQLAERTERTGG